MWISQVALLIKVHLSDALFLAEILSAVRSLFGRIKICESVDTLKLSVLFFCLSFPSFRLFLMNLVNVYRIGEKCEP